MKDPLSDVAFLNGGNMAYLESLYQESINLESDWGDVFASLPDLSPGGGAALEGGSQTWFESSTHKQAQVSKLITAYRSLGHLLADVDPIGVMPRGDTQEVELSAYQLSEQDLDTEFDIGDVAEGGRRTLRSLLGYLQQVYCGPIGCETRYITDLKQRGWLKDQLETDPVRPTLSDEERREFLSKLTAAEGLEKYLHTKYVGQKRFSLEGGDVLVPMMSDMIQQFGSEGVNEVVIGMAHRGRLNFLVNILGKSPKELFSEFEGEYQTEDADTQTGDVKYHQGASSDIQTPGGNVHVALSFNPSHLEIINPVVEGSVRARQQRRGDLERKKVIPVLIHGDAAFAGQGVVMETLQMSTTRGYSTGGTIHLIINNQIGFTTNTLDARSTLYCTEVAKMVQAPIFHINGDDPDAVIFATRMALQYRMKFGGDVVLDVVCYRRHGHNEADEPTITQPIMYSKIKAHKTPREIYAETLIAQGVVSAEESAAMIENYRDQLDQGHIVAGQMIDPNKARKVVDWEPYSGKRWDEDVDTSINKQTLTRLIDKLSDFPDDFVVHNRVQKVLKDRTKMVAGELPMDWGCAELLAYASLLEQDYRVRLSGQDAGRGTFSHRHVTLHDQSVPRTHIPMQYIPPNHTDFLVINSLLSEEAVLGFEYGYSTTDPKTLVIWEGQFGDFVNGAQVVIDQFISSGQAKWARICSLGDVFTPWHGRAGPGAFVCQAWSDFCSYARNTICRCASRPLRHRCFICCADR